MKKIHIVIALIISFFLSTAPVNAETTVYIEINKGKVIKLPRKAASVVVANPDTADVQVLSPSTIFVYGRKTGETSISVVDADDKVILQRVVNITHNFNSMEKMIKKISPDSDIELKTTNEGLVVSGYAPSIKDSQNVISVVESFIGEGGKLVNMINTAGGDQVNLQVKIVEMSRSDLKTLGINLQSSVTGGGILSQVVTGSLDATSLVGRAVSGNANILTSLTSGNNTISSLIDLLETQGLATVLAEPSLTTVTGKPASFLAGGQYPIPVAGSEGTITVEYQPFGVSLNFTPVVMSNDRISILVTPEVSTLNFSNPIQVNGFNYPILDTRKANATVELGSGQTFVLAGLLRNDTSNNLSKVPGVGDIPVLGALFRSQRFQSSQTELVILVTPYIVRPISNPESVQTPLDGFNPPTDTERLLFGSIHRQEKMPKQEQENIESLYGEEEYKLNGESGFILE
ncbi:MAG: type II and III secretion system protein family protein [Rickettsiales bacterium]